MVQHVERIHAEIQFMPFLKVDLLAKAQVPVLLEWTTESVTRNGAVAGRRCSRSRVGEPRRAIGDYRSRREAGRIEIRYSCGKLALNASGVVGRGKRPA